MEDTHLFLQSCLHQPTSSSCMATPSRRDILTRRASRSRLPMRLLGSLARSHAVVRSESANVRIPASQPTRHRAEAGLDREVDLERLRAGPAPREGERRQQHHRSRLIGPQEDVAEATSFPVVLCACLVKELAEQVMRPHMEVPRDQARVAALALRLHERRQVLRLGHERCQVLVQREVGVRRGAANSPCTRPDRRRTRRAFPAASPMGIQLFLPAVVYPSHLYCSSAVPRPRCLVRTTVAFHIAPFVPAIQISSPLPYVSIVGEGVRADPAGILPPTPAHWRFARRVAIMVVDGRFWH